MTKKSASVWVLSFLPAALIANGVAAQEPRQVPGASVQPGTGEPFVLNLPPTDGGPVVIRGDFEFQSISEIDDEAETFQFSGVLTLTWQDARQAFDPIVAGVKEKTYTGEFQFNELSPGWYPEVILVNEAGTYETQGVVHRVRADGTQTLVQSINAVAKTELSMRRFPFDEHRLEAEFQVLGYDDTDVILQVAPADSAHSGSHLHIPQWAVGRIELSTRDRADSDGSGQTASTLVVGVDAKRRSFFMIRLVMLPLAVIVLLSFSVFWMDRSSLGDRLSVSFIGILTGVAYQITIADSMPHISYMTLMHGFINLSFVTMCATVVINLSVGALDKRGRSDTGDLVDRRCRWIFPLVYFGWNLIIMSVALTFF